MEVKRTINGLGSRGRLSWNEAQLGLPALSYLVLTASVLFCLPAGASTESSASTPESVLPAAGPSADTSSAKPESASSPDVNAERLSERAQQRWDAMVDGDFERAYAFELPTYRNLFTLNTFKAQYAGSRGWVKAAVTSVDEPGGARAKVEIQVSQQIPIAPGAAPEILAATVAEMWLFRDGAWWRVPPLGDTEASHAIDAETPEEGA